VLGECKQAKNGQEKQGGWGTVSTSLCLFSLNERTKPTSGGERRDAVWTSASFRPRHRKGSKGVMCRKNGTHRASGRGRSTQGIVRNICRGPRWAASEVGGVKKKGRRSKIKGPHHFLKRIQDDVEGKSLQKVPTGASEVKGGIR